MKKYKGISFFLVLLFGPFGLWYWSWKLALASFFGMTLFVLLLTYFGYGVGISQQILIRVVFLWVNIKFYTMTEPQLSKLTTMTGREFLHIVWSVFWYLMIFGFIGFAVYQHL